MGGVNVRIWKKHSIMISEAKSEQRCLLFLRAERFRNADLFVSIIDIRD